jgi:hypothetical protein
MSIKFFVLPISGNLFSFQLGQVIFCLKAVGSIDIVPDVVFGASGGNIVGYVCHANDWNVNSILSSLRFIDSQAFMTSWFTPISYFYFKSIFSRGYGFEPFLNYFYDPCKKSGVSQKLKKGTEILTGVVCNNKKTKKNTYKIFSNKEKNDGIIPSSSSGASSSFLDFKCENIEYLNGSVKEVCEIILDSASIPFIIKDRCIEEEEGAYHSDAGTMYSSPFSIFSHKLFESGKILKGFFFNPEFHKHCVKKTNEVSLFCEMKNLIATTYSHEIRTFISLICSYSGMTAFSEPLVYEKMSTSSFKTLYTDLESTNYHYGVIFCLSDHFETAVNLFTVLTVEQLLKDISVASNNITAFVWRKK